MSSASSRRRPPIWSRRPCARFRRSCCSCWSSMCARRASSAGASGPAMARLARSRLLWIALALLVAALTLPLWVSAYMLGVLTAAYYFGVFAMSWDLLFGFAGEVNFGPTFLIGLGAYAAALLNSDLGLGIPLCVAAGAAVATLGGLLLAVPALRLTGPYFGLVTLVAVLLLQNAIVIFAGVTGGEIGMTVPDVLSIDEKINYWYALVLLVICGIILFGLSR